MNSDWWDKAACKGMDVGLFFSQASVYARSICQACPVILECREYIDRIEGLESTRYISGVFCGETPSARVKRRRNVRNEKAP